MTKDNENKRGEQGLSEGELVDQKPLEPIADPAVKLAGYNQIPDLGEDTRGTLQDTNDESEDE